MERPASLKTSNPGVPTRAGDGCDDLSMIATLQKVMWRRNGEKRFLIDTTDTAQEARVVRACEDRISQFSSKIETNDQRFGLKEIKVSG